MATKWPEVALGEVAAIERNVRAPEDIESGCAYVGLEHIESGGRRIDKQLVAHGDLASAKFEFTERHILYGKLRPYLAKIALPDFRGVCSTDIVPILPGSMINRSYLCHYLRQQWMVDLATSRSSGANLPRLSPTELSSFCVPLPPIEEQRRIAAVLDKADTLRSQRAAVQELLRALDAELFERALMDLDGSPRVPLGDVVERVTVGHVGPTSQFFSGSGVPFIRTGNIGEGVVVRKDLRFVTEDFHARLKKSALKAGDLLVCRVVTDRVRTAVVPPDLDGANCANVIVVRPGPAMSARYLGALIRHRDSQAALLGRRVGSAQSVVNTRVLQDWRIPVPPASSLRAIDRQFGALDAFEQCALASAFQFDDLFASLQQRAFRGDL